jgi:hypothetical protein
MKSKYLDHLAKYKEVYKTSLILQSHLHTKFLVENL